MTGPQDAAARAAARLRAEGSEESLRLARAIERSHEAMCEQARRRAAERPPRRHDYVLEFSATEGDFARVLAIVEGLPASRPSYRFYPDERRHHAQDQVDKAGELRVGAAR